MSASDEADNKVSEADSVAPVKTEKAVLDEPDDIVIDPSDETDDYDDSSSWESVSVLDIDMDESDDEGSDFDRLTE